MSRKHLRNNATCVVIKVDRLSVPTLASRKHHLQNFSIDVSGDVSGEHGMSHARLEQNTVISF